MWLKELGRSLVIMSTDSKVYNAFLYKYLYYRLLNVVCRKYLLYCKIISRSSKLEYRLYLHYQIKSIF